MVLTALPISTEALPLALWMVNKGTFRYSYFTMEPIQITKLQPLNVSKKLVATSYQGEAEFLAEISTPGSLIT
ncbi:hypothetical protein OSB04_005052 [Centaurea solstitialis]|uniref:Uncharacterized protein n=1 Tax=Centaurea solstitialis TaxID=347529 RepID=A0AA38WGF2_9ASTR|nr:hypothetical protein OSB04_005052 [Centaurea solstitialis]